MAQQETYGTKQWAGIVAQAWSDENFKKRLLADPAGVLRQRGIQFATGQRVVIVEDTDKVVHLILPRKPDGALGQEALELILGGTALGSAVSGAGGGH